MRYACALLLAISASSAAAAEGRLAERLRGYLEAHEANGDFMGEVVYLDGNGRVTRVIVGMADIESRRPHQRGDIYHIASMTKQFTGAAIAKLAEDRKLSLDAPVSRYFPDFPHADEITVAGLVHQFAGVPDYNDFPDYSEKIRQDLPLSEVVAWISDRAGDFEPNPGYAYSNSHFAMLARIIELVSGQPYPDYLESEILGPAGMTSTAAYSTSEIVVKRVEGYDPGPNGTLVNAPEINNSIKAGSGALYSTSDDLVRWHEALQSERLLSNQAKAAYFTPREGYAMGVGVWTDDETGERLAAHDGKSPGGFAYMKRWLDSGRALLVLSNVNSGQLGRFKTDLTKIVNGESVPLPEARRPRSLAPGEAGDLVGNYLFPPDSNIRIDLKDGSLVLYWRDTGLAQYLVALEGSDWFYMPSRAERVHFVRDEQGRVTGLEYDWGNAIQFCERLDDG